MEEPQLPSHEISQNTEPQPTTCSLPKPSFRSAHPCWVGSPNSLGGGAHLRATLCTARCANRFNHLLFNKTRLLVQACPQRDAHPALTHTSTSRLALRPHFLFLHSIATRHRVALTADHLALLQRSPTPSCAYLTAAHPPAVLTAVARWSVTTAP